MLDLEGRVGEGDSLEVSVGCNRLAYSTLLSFILAILLLLCIEEYYSEVHVEKCM